jgi:hypothetical protein
MKAVGFTSAHSSSDAKGAELHFHFARAQHQCDFPGKQQQTPNSPEAEAYPLRRERHGSVHGPVRAFPHDFTNEMSSQV